MGKIVVLDELTINQIAAGEVIERPINVIKELVENSIDAKANNITVEVKNAGKTYIKIIDNGCGIEKDDMFIAIERHSTSKIRKIDDLEHTYTMGFRGEALSSIASISKLTISSKTQNEELGLKIVSEEGEIIETQECGMHTGTITIVENLFFNVPVRYKFLKQDATELKYIKDWIQKVALANSDISFKLISENKTIFFSNGNSNMQDIIYSIYGKEIQENLVEVDYKEENIKITGVVGNTLIARDSRKDQILFLNKRNIKNIVLTNSADQAFKGSTGIGKYGFFILNIEMSADNYDVNVHPTKMEVRFKDEEKISRILYTAIKNSILDNEFLGNTQKTDKKEYIENEYNFLSNNTTKVENQDIIKREEARKIEYKYVGILFKTYIIIEVGDEIFLIDQHAAHERVLYEQIKANYKNKINNSQMTLIPEVINLSPKEMDFLKNNIELFQKIGFDIDFFGENAIKINGIPDLEYKSKTKNIFLDTLDELISTERTTIKDIEERFIATVACKAAVKANMNLTQQEVDKLIQNLLSLNNPYTCPHGRPTTIKFDKNNMDKNM